MVFTSGSFESYLRALLLLPWHFLRGALWLGAGWLVLWQAMRWWPSDRVWLVAFSNYFAPWILLLLLPTIGLAWLTRQRALTAILLFSALLIAFRLAPLFLFKSPATTTTRDLKVMTFNVHGRNNNVEGILGLILREEPDLIAFQELSPVVAAGLVDALGDRYPYHTLESDQRVWGQGLLSRYPMQATSELPDYRYLSAVVQAPQGAITVLNVHPPTPFQWERQHGMFRSLAEQIASIDGPLLVVGDFNTTDQSENYALVRRYLTDAFQESGWGFGFSFPATAKLGIQWLRPLVRIDYIFHNDFFASHDTRVLEENGGSDHRPVVSTLSFRRAAQQGVSTAWR